MGVDSHLEGTARSNTNVCSVCPQYGANSGLRQSLLRARSAYIERLSTEDAEQYVGRPVDGWWMAISGASSFIEGVPDAGNRRSEWSNAAMPLRSDPFRFCLLALIVFSLSRLSGYFGILRVLRPALLLFAFCVLYAFLHRRKLVRKNLSRSVAVRLILGLGGFFLMGRK